MEIELEKYTFNQQKLEKFGFCKCKEGLCYTQPIMNQMFELKIKIAQNGKINWQVCDPDTGDEYSLVKTTAEGAFVGSLRIACQCVFYEIATTCGVPTVFKSKQASLVQSYILQKYGDQLEFLWEKTPDNAIFRRQDNKKWYGAILTILQNKIGLPDLGKIEILDLRSTPQEIITLIDRQKYFPAYHMNKKNWLTICLNDSVETNEIYRRIDESYLLAKK